MALIFAGLLVDLYPQFAGRPFAWPRSITPIFWMMAFGALGLVLGPWVQSNWFSVPGLVLHLAATFWLLANVTRPLIGDRQAWSPGHHVRLDPGPGSDRAADHPENPRLPGGGD